MDEIQKFMRKLLLFILLLSFQCSVRAAKIYGTIKDSKDSSVLTGVVVAIKNTNIVAETDVDGKFEIPNVENGSYELFVYYVSYKKYSETIIVNGKKDVQLNIFLSPEGKELKSISVSALRTTNSENAVIQEIKKVNSIASGISATQIAKTMDRNAADVVKRVPGVTIRDDKYIIIRGLNDRYNTVWLNDAGAPSSEVDKKSFSFDIIPSGLIDRILIFKTPAPDLPGDFAGGMVKVYTTSLPSNNQLNIGIQTSYRQYATGQDFFYNTKSSTDWLGYDNKTRSLPKNTPDYINKTDPDAGELTKSFNNDWIINKKKTPLDLRFNLSSSNLFKLGKVNAGNTFGLSYSSTNTNTNITRQDWDSANEIYHYNDHKTENKINIGLLDNLVFVVGNSKIEFKNLYSRVASSTVIQRNNIADTLLATSPDERSYLMGYDEKATYASQLTGTHKNADETRKYTWTLGYTDLYKNQPDLRRIKYTKAAGTDDSNFKASIANIVDPVNGGGRLYASLSEKVYSFNHQFSQKIKIGSFDFDVILGNYIEFKQRFSSYRVLGYTIKPGQEAFTLTHLPINEIFAQQNVGESGKFLMDEITNGYDKYAANNELFASFLALKIPIKKLTIYTGVRNEYNIQSLKTDDNGNTIEPKVKTNFWLPSANLSYNFSEKSLVRLAYGKTLNRPEFREWAPVYFYDFELLAGVQGSLRPNSYSPNGDTLKVAEIQNIDVRYEWYPEQNELVHAGLFYKNFKNPIQSIIVPGSGTDSKKFTFANGESAFVYGAELDIRKSLSFFDNIFKTDFIKDISFVGNLSISNSELKLDSSRIKDLIPKSKLQGQSPYVVNAGFYYQNSSNTLSGSILYNVFGPRLYVVGTKDDPSLGELPFHSLDFSLTKTFYKHYMISLGVQNILNQSTHFVKDTNKDGKFTKDDPNYSNFHPGRYYSLGIKVKI